MVVGMLTLLTATAYANHADIKAKLNCTSQTEVCFDLTVSTSDFPDTGRDIKVMLFGHAKNDAKADHFVPVGEAQPVHLDKDLKDKTISVCFKDVKTTDFDKFQIEIVAVQIKPGDFDVNGMAKVTLGPFDNTCPTPAPSTPTPSTPTPTTSSNTGAVLASTGGFDFRFPLLGLAILVAGATLFVVSASRGRSTSDR
jgi:hypothetical protein